MDTKNVAIIGAGSSGLASIKTCLDEGLKPVCFEQSDDIGGLWNYCPPSATDGIPSRPSVYRSCTINTSKEMSSFSDFPVPEEFPMFLPHRYVLRYFRLYADHFRLLEHIRFKCSVLSVFPADDYDISGAWTVSYQDDKGCNHSERYSAVFVCSGHHRFKHQPELYGQERFTGPVLHSSEYRTPEQLDGKKVLVVGKN